MPIPLPPQLSEGAPQDKAVSTPVARMPGRPRRPSGRRRLAAALVACFGSVLLAGGAVNRALDPLSGGVCTGVTVEADAAESQAAPPFASPGAPAAAVGVPHQSCLSEIPEWVRSGRPDAHCDGAPDADACREQVRRVLAAPRPPEARLGRTAEGFRPDPFVPLPR